MFTSRLFRVLLALTVVSAAALAQVVRPTGASVGEKLRTTLPPAPTPAAPPAATAAAGLGYEIVQVVSLIAPKQQLSKTTASSPPGKKVVGGGYMVGGSFGFRMVESYPTPTGDGWTTTVFSEHPIAMNGIFYAVWIIAS